MKSQNDLNSLIEKYYEDYYKIQLGLPDWKSRINLRLEEEEIFCLRFINWIEEWLNYNFSGKKVLVVGCGTGGELVNLKKKNAEVYGIEPNEDALRICQIKASQNGIPKENILKGYSESIPFDDSYFDFVYCFTVLEHVSDVEQSISEMVRCVKNKGKVFIETPDYRQLYEGHYKLPLPMFLPVWINKLLLKLFRRPTKFIESINKVNSNILIKHYSKLPVTPIRVYRDNSVSFPSFKPNISFLVEITQYLIHKFLGININQFWLLHKGIN